MQGKQEKVCEICKEPGSLWNRQGNAKFCRACGEKRRLANQRRSNFERQKRIMLERRKRERIYDKLFAAVAKANPRYLKTIK